MARVKLAEALLRRKELQDQVARLEGINVKDLFEVKAKRVNVTESLDDITAKVPKISMQQVTHCYNWHAKQLRKVDAAIQHANWETEVEVDDEVMNDYVDPYVADKPDSKTA